MKFETLPNRHSELMKILVDIDLSNLAVSVVIYDFTLLTYVTLEVPFMNHLFSRTTSGDNTRSKTYCSSS